MTPDLDIAIALPVPPSPPHPAVDPVRWASVVAAAAAGLRVHPLHTPLGAHDLRRCSCSDPKCTSVGKHPRTSYLTAGRAGPAWVTRARPGHPQAYPSPSHRPQHPYRTAGRNPRQGPAREVLTTRPARPGQPPRCRCHSDRTPSLAGVTLRSDVPRPDRATPSPTANHCSAAVRPRCAARGRCAREGPRTRSACRKRGVVATRPWGSRWCAARGPSLPIARCARLYGRARRPRGAQLLSPRR